MLRIAMNSEMSWPVHANFMLSCSGGQACRKYKRCDFTVGLNFFHTFTNFSLKRNVNYRQMYANSTAGRTLKFCH